MFPQTAGEEAQGGVGHVDAGRVDKHAKPLVETVLLVENPSTGGFLCLSSHLHSWHGRLERAQPPKGVQVGALCPDLCGQLLHLYGKLVPGLR